MLINMEKIKQVLVDCKGHGVWWELFSWSQRKLHWRSDFWIGTWRVKMRKNHKRPCVRTFPAEKNYKVIINLVCSRTVSQGGRGIRDKLGEIARDQVPWRLVSHRKEFGFLNTWQKTFVGFFKVRYIIPCGRRTRGQQKWKQKDQVGHCCWCGGKMVVA